MESGNSSFSPLNVPRRLQRTAMPVEAQGVNNTTTTPPQAASPESSWYEYPDASGTGADAIHAETSGVTDQRAEAQEEEEEEEEEEVEREEEGDAKSETSSVMYDPEVDPEGFARRLDELAGTLEVGQVEARALRWGPAIASERQGELCLSLVVHYAKHKVLCCR